MQLKDYVFDFENILSVYFNNDRVGYIMATSENKALHIHCLHQSNDIYVDALTFDECDFADLEILQATLNKYKEYAASAIFDELLIRRAREFNG